MMNPAVIVWPGGEHPFRLALAQLEGLQKATDCGPEWLAMKLRSGQWLATEAFEILRWGLIGGGMKREDAERRAKEAFINGDVSELNLLAFTIISNSLRAKEHDPLGEPAAAENPPE